MRVPLRAQLGGSHVRTPADNDRVEEVVYAADMSGPDSCRTVGLQVKANDEEHALRTQIGSRPIRPLSSIILPREQIDKLVADAETFLGSEAWYGEALAAVH